MTDWLSIELENMPFVALDLETTGLKFQEGHRICELGLVRYSAQHRIGQLSMLVNPERPIPSDAIRVHGITDSSVKSAPLFKDIADLLLEFIGDLPLVVYNVDFDLGFLNFQLRSINREPLDNYAIDALEIARRLEINRKGTGYKLSVIARTLNVQHTSRRGHRALYDAYITAEVFRALIPHLKSRELSTMTALMSWLGQDRHRIVEMNRAFTQAILDNHLLRIVYRSMNNVVSDRAVRPIRIEERNNEFFLRAYCTKSEDERVFSVRRILEWEIIESSSLQDEKTQNWGKSQNDDLPGKKTMDPY